MVRLHVQLLGTFEVSVNDQPITNFYSDKVRALLAYLVLRSDQVHSRLKLAGLLWPEYDDKRARQSLRQALLHLRKAIGNDNADPPHLLITRSTLQFNSESDQLCDVAAFDHALRQTDGAQAALKLYRDDLLTGFFLNDCQEFNTWLIYQREHYRNALLAVLQTLVSEHEQDEAWDTARDYANRWLHLEPWQEEAHRALMRIYLATGDKKASLAQYEQCETVLAEELGVEPTSETQALYQEILLGDQQSATMLPTPATAFIGRNSELSTLRTLLQDSTTRLITILGHGGTGKTRLSLEMATQSGIWRHGVHFVGLARIDSATVLIPTIADALNLTFSGAKTPKQQLLEQLRDRNMLLILDNFEHLLNQGDDTSRRLVGELVRECPSIKFLITSRQRLNLHAESIFIIDGLHFPQETTQFEEIATFDAVKLFLASAKRQRRTFSLTPANAIDIIRICQLVDGMPLALELAAAWVPILTPAEIAEEIERGLDVLSVDMIDLPTRHQSVRAVCDYSVQQLPEHHRQILYRFAVFRGGFDHEAVRQIAQANPLSLRKLIDRSLLRRNVAGHDPTVRHGRYQMHEIIRQYGQEKLRQQGDLTQWQQAHKRYYLQLAETATDLVNSADQVAWVKRLSAEHDNMRAALRRALATADVDSALRLSIALAPFWKTRGHYSEGRDWLVQALAHPTHNSAQRANTLIITGELAQLQGDLPAATEYAHEAEKLVEDDQILIAKVTLLKGVIALAQGELKMAEEKCQQSLAIFRAHNCPHKIANTLNTLGRIAHWHEDIPSAKVYFEESLDILRQINNPRRIAVALNNLATVVRRMERPEDYAHSDRLLRESLALRKTVGDKRGSAITLWNLAANQFQFENYDEAAKLYRESMHLAYAVGARRLVAGLLAQIATIAEVNGDAERAVILCSGADKLNEAVGFSRPRHERERYDEVMVFARERLNSAEMEAAYAQGQRRSLDDLVAYALET